MAAIVCYLILHEQPIIMLIGEPRGKM